MARRVFRAELLAPVSERLWDLYEAGESVSAIARAVSVERVTVRRHIAEHGGTRPAVRCRAPGQLTLEEREEISRGLVRGLSFNAIGAQLGRHGSSISREVGRNGGRECYRAAAADMQAWQRARRLKPCKLVTAPELALIVTDKLNQRWSPQQISGWLAREYPDRPEMQVSHETIYRTLFLQSRGALRRQLTQQLRTNRTVRMSKAHNGRGQGRGQIVAAVPISERPAEVDDRAVPGHWEGDLVIGTHNSAIATLVERTSRLVMLISLENTTSEHVLGRLAEHVVTLPEQLRRSVTWDRGLEMSRHVAFTIDTGVQIYLCDPRSPWQRGSNENTNGLLRQYFPKRKANFSDHSQDDLNRVAAELNDRPRKTLGYMAPSEVFAEAVAATP
jgi:IS30 family transposase